MNDSPTNIPPTPLKIIISSLIVLFVVIPVLAVVKSGQMGSIPTVVAGGLTFVVIFFGLMFLHRIILWIHYRFYWYVAAVVYAIFFMVGIIIAFNVSSSPRFAVLDTLPNWVNNFFLFGAIVSLVVIAFVFGRRSASHTPVVNPPTAPTAPSVSTPQTQVPNPAQQVAARKQGLGIGPTKGSP
ncbi:MAG: hypothetical protein GC179_07910 [Anaerolineaceae bacterium]|nr:hypothetical protein [Anaerolineaceae bacterium]